jgi:uncharacterized RDD family membrane protein YckC
MACGRPIEARAGAPAGLSLGSPGDTPGEVDARGFEMAAPPGEYAGFWIRLLAYLLDWIFVFLLSVTLGFLIGLALGVQGVSVGEEMGGALPPGEYAVFLLSVTLSFLLGLALGVQGVSVGEEMGGALGSLVWLVVYFVYYTYYFGSSGQVWGKRICGLRVIRVDGGRLGYGRAFARVLGYWLSFLLLGVGFLMIAFTRRSQGLHDKLIGSCVIRVR